MMMRCVFLLCVLPLVLAIHHETEQHVMDQQEQEQEQQQEQQQDNPLLTSISMNAALLPAGSFLPAHVQIPKSFLMNEGDLIRATQGGARKHYVASLQPWTSLALQTIERAEVQWFNINKWLISGGYEFNWDYMWEPITKRYRSYVIPQKSQRCGTCWAFSTSAMISAHLAIRYGIDRATPQWWPEDIDPISLAEGELFECTAAPGSDTCYGNWIQNAAVLVQSNGLAQNADYAFNNANAAKCRGAGCGPSCPTTATVTNCNFWPQTCPAITDPRRKNNPRFKIDHLVSVVGSGPSGVNIDPWVGSASYPLQVAQIRNLLRTKGPLGFYFRVESGFGLNGNDIFPSNGAVYTKTCLNTGLNHAMVLIGYGRTASTDPQPNLDYWLVLNSWGNWSTDGIIKIKAGINLCGIENIVFYPEFSSIDLTARDPCTSQAGGVVGQLACFRSICDKTILSDSRYCQSTGRHQYCSRARSHCPTQKCQPKCKCTGSILSPSYIKCSLNCAQVNKNNPCLAAGLPTDCYYYDEVCRPHFSIDSIWDLTAKLDDILTPAGINLKAPLVASSIIPKPIALNTKLADLVTGVVNSNPNIVNTKLVAQIV